MFSASRVATSLARAGARRAPLAAATASSSRSLSTARVARSSGGGSGQGSSRSFGGLFAAAGAAAGAAALWLTQRDRIAFAKGTVDYDAIRAEIASLLENESWDDGSYGPVLIRLAWHSSGTYDRVSGTGGSNGARMRFNPEAGWGANAGLLAARDLLEKVKANHPEISYSDLWTLAGCVAIEEMGGPKITWRPGRSDAVSGDGGPPDGRLPDASRGQDHVRDIFYRMGFNDREIVALVGGGHAIGRCHKDRSGYDGPWTYSPTTFSSEFFRVLVEEEWRERKWDGPKQYENVSTGTLMMLPADMVFITDPAFAVYTRMYARDNELFFKDFKAAWEKLITLGVPGQ